MKLPTFKLKSILNPRRLIPLGILFAGITIISFLMSAGPKLEPKPKKVKLPNVEVMNLLEENISIPVHTRGIVNPATQIQLTSDVNGTVIAVSKKLSDGSFFRKGDWLVKIDRSHYEMELERAQAQEANARVHLLQTQANIRSGKIEGINVGRRSELAQGTPQLKEAEAQYEAAKSTVRLAQQQLEKTTVVAPFDGRVQKKAIDIKEFSSAGKPIAQIYAIDRAEVRLPLSAAQLELVDVPLRYVDDSDISKAPLVIFEDANGNQWSGRIVRSEGNVDPRNRLNYVVAVIKAPYARDPNNPDRPPLAAGTFVDASIQGRLYRNIVSVPRDAIHSMDTVWVIDNENRLHVRPVDVLYRGKDRVYIKEGLQGSDKIVLTPLDVMVENMEVAVVKESEPLAPIAIHEKFAEAATEPLRKKTTPTAEQAEIKKPADKQQFSKQQSGKPADKQPSSKPAAVTTKAVKKDKPSSAAEPPVSTPDFNISPEDMSGMMGTEQESDI